MKEDVKASLKEELTFKLAQLLGANLYHEQGELTASFLGQETGHAASEAENEVASDLKAFLHSQEGEGLWPSISTDTRTIKKGDCFVALIGTQFDGHDYLLQAIERGAKLAIVDDSHWKNQHRSWREQGLAIPLLVVSDTLKAYQSLAGFYRSCFLPCLVAITGSVGKTSTREMVACALEACTCVYRTQENLNNEIGVPKTILDTPMKTAISVIEMGMDRPGDIRLLAKMTKPNLAIITGIGFSHLAFFGTQEAILRAKAEIVEGLKKDGYLLLHAHDPYLLKLSHELLEQKASCKQAFVSVCEPGEDFTFDLPGPCFVAKNLDSDDNGRYSYDLFLYEAKGQQTDAQQAGGQTSGAQQTGGQTFNAKTPTCLARGIQLAVAGKHQVVNSLYALLTAYLLNQPLEQAILGLNHYKAIGNRQRMLEIAGMTVINDSYNTAPESMLAALKTLALMAEKQKRHSVAILACIAELGEKSAKIHMELGQKMASLGIDHIYLCGEFAPDIAKGLLLTDPSATVKIFVDRDALGDFVIPRLAENDIILIKGSRSYQMERICDRILDEKMEK